MYLARVELNQLFTSNISEKHQSARLALKALLETMSTLKNNVIVYSQKGVKYWLIKTLASILKCRGCKEDLGQIIMGRLEFDFFPKVDHDKETKYWLLRSDAAYYHPSINCM